MVITEIQFFDLDKKKYGKYCYEFLFGPRMKRAPKITCLLTAKQANQLSETDRYGEQIYGVFDGGRYVWSCLKDNIKYIENHFGAKYEQYWIPLETDSERKHKPKIINEEVEVIDELIR